MKIKRNDIVLIALLIAAALILSVVLFLNKTDGDKVTVKVNNELIGTYSLNEDMTLKIGDNNSYNILVIKDNTAKITEATCPDKLCVNQKAISYDLESIICLPNKVVVEIISEEESNNDSVAN